MTRATTTPSEALAQLIAECKLLDASEVGERWNQFNGAIAVAEMVLRDDKESEIWHVQKLRDAAADPMLYAHAEVSKSLLLGAANIIEAASARIAKLKSASQDPYAYAYECCQPGTDGKGWAQFINRKPVTPKDGVRNVIPLYTAPAVSQPAAAPASVTQTLRDIGELLRTQDNRATDQPMFIVQQKRLYVTAEDYNDYRIEWHESERGDYQPASPLRAARLEVLHRGCREYPGWTRLAVHDVWEFVTACVTEQGCKDYIARNGHNLNEPRIYAEGSYRNEEFHAIRNWLMSLAAAPLHESGSAAAGQTDFLKWVVMTRPGMVPVRKGPLADVAHTESMLRELYDLHPDCTCIVIEMPNDCMPNSGIEWLDIYGDKRRKPVRRLPSIAAPTEVERDAKRYRWLRNKSLGYEQIGTFTPYVVIGQIMDTVDGRRLDEKIDAAIATGENNG